MKYVVHSIMNQKPKTILIDSSNLLHRAVWIAENVRKNVNPSYIFLTSVKKYAQMFDCSEIYSVWDKRLVRGIKNYRRQAKQVEYKGTRDAKKNEKVFSHEDTTTELLNCLGVKNMYPGILEADDVISWLCSKLKGHKVVVSVDQDMLQLVDEETDVYSPIKDVHINTHNFEEVTTVKRDQFLRYKSLMGDKSDNLPGVEKCGPKTALKLVNNHPTDDTLLENLGEEKLKPYFANLKLIDLTEGHRQHPDDVKLYEEQFHKLQQHEPEFTNFKSMCESLNMNKIVDQIDQWKDTFAPEKLNETLQDIVNKLQLHK